MTLMRIGVLCVLTVTSVPAWGETVTSSTGAPVEEATVEEATVEEAPTPTLEDRVAELEGKTMDLVEGTTEMRNVVEILSRVKLTAYAQGRFEWHGDAEDGVNAQNRAINTTQFLLRRGRIKATWGFEVAELMLQIDATPKGVVLKDAEATFIEPWTTQYSRITAGQFKWPFGYEVLQSSEFRQMPERSRIVRALFPGERDRGFRVQGLYEWFRFAAAIVNGNGTEDSIYGATDSNGFKDVVGRFGIDLDWLAIGASGYYGEGLATKLGQPTADPPVAPTMTPYKKTRIGLDAQLYLDVPDVGGLALKAEVMGGTEPSTTPWGFWAQVSQNFGESFGIFARGELYDPDLDADADTVVSFGGGAQYFINGYLKATAAYEHPITPAAAGQSELFDDTLTVQVQAMFF